jgi:lipopolysaccharide transport system permease protein
MQAIWFVSPVYFEPKVFVSAGLTSLLIYNPVTHILDLVRKPLLEGIFPSLLDYLFVFVITVFLFIISWKRIKKEEDELIYYL